MANICSTCIRFYSKHKEQLERMRQRLLEIVEIKSEEDDFGKNWLGKYANEFFPEYGADRIDCGGWVDGLDVKLTQVKNSDYYMFGLWTMTKWSAKIGLWREIVTKFYPDVKIAYIADECGCGYFVKWDETPGQIFFPQQYYADGYLPKNGGGYEYTEDKLEYGTLEDIYKYFDEHLPFSYRHTENVWEMTKEIQCKLDEYEDSCERSEDLYVQIEKYDEVSPADFEFLL